MRDLQHINYNMKLFDTLLSLIAPHDCLGCQSEGTLVCDDCARGLPAALPRCYKCHVERVNFSTCSVCRQSSALSTVWPAVRYETIAKDLVWKLKFGRARDAAMVTSRIIVRRLQLRRQLRLAGPVIITHAPTAASRTRQRGYDQAQLIARAMAASTGTPYRPLLARLGTTKQVGATKAQRATQVAQAFRAINAAQIRGAHILIVDDVITTGATLEAAARTLRAAGARRVDAVTFAQA